MRQTHKRALLLVASPSAILRTAIGARSAEERRIAIAEKNSDAQGRISILSAFPAYPRAQPVGESSTPRLASSATSERMVPSDSTSDVMAIFDFEERT